MSKDDLIGAVWHGRMISESTLSSRITAVRHAVNDRGEEQRLIRTIARKGFRFVGEVKEQQTPPRERELTGGTQSLPASSEDALTS